MSVRYVSRGSRAEMIGRKCPASVSLIERLFVILQFCVFRLSYATCSNLKEYTCMYIYIMSLFKEWFSLVANAA